MAKKWTKQEITALITEMKNAQVENEEDVDDSAAFDIAEGIILSEDGLKESIMKEYNIKEDLVNEWLGCRL